MHGILDGAHPGLGNAAVVARHQHRPLRQGHEYRVVHLELHRQVELLRPGVEARRCDVRFQPAQDCGMRGRGEMRRLEVGGQAHLKHIHFFFRRAEGLRVGAAERHERRVEAVPDRGIGVAVPAGRDCDARNARQVGQRRHVHDGHARHLRLRHRIEQLAHAWGAVLRLLHGQHDQVVVGGSDRPRPVGGELTRQLARIDFHQPVAPLDRHAHARTLLVEQLDFIWQANQLRGGKQQLGCQERAVGRAEDQDLQWTGHAETPRFGDLTM